LIFLLLLITQKLLTQTVRYSPAWFGPNANPVPEFSDGTIAKYTKIDAMADYYFGFGDETRNLYIKAEIPLVSERVSFKFWSTFFERYNVTPELSAARNMQDGNTSGRANGDLYVQTRISLANEKKILPAIIFNTTLKTSSGTADEYKRYFDTMGYAFDFEFAKSFHTNAKFINTFRIIANAGFLCWETTNSTQNDAVMYGIKFIFGAQKWNIDQTFAGYTGWMARHPNYGADYGDAPIVYALKFNLQPKKVNYFVQYQYGLRDFPYHQMRLGVNFNLEKLTPKF